MVRAQAGRPPVLPECPKHSHSHVVCDGFTAARWSDKHRRPRYRCIFEPKTRGHSFSLPVADAAQPREVAQVLRRGGSAGQLRDRATYDWMESRMNACSTLSNTTRYRSSGTSRNGWDISSHGAREGLGQVPT